MDKRDEFIAELRDGARKKGLLCHAEKWHGKGGDAFVGDRLTTVPSILPRIPMPEREVLISFPCRHGAPLFSLQTWSTSL
jgi:hypothetical protein